MIKRGVFRIVLREDLLPHYNMMGGPILMAIKDGGTNDE